MGGAITVKSVKNQGTTFTVELPFDVSGNNYKSDDVALEDIRVLVVDDDPDSRSYLATVLTRMGVKFRCSASGPEALQALASASEHGKLFDICIIDWKMPRMDGLELTRQIRKLYDRDMIIIVASSYDHYDQDQEAQNAGVDTFVSKPLFQSTLFDLFMTLSKGRIHKLDKTIETPNFSGCRALLVEDNPINVQVATGLLLKANLVCEYASDGLKGVEKFEASPAGYYDIVLMDIQMPVMDGYTAAQRIRASSHPDAQSVPIVAMTADAFTEDVAKAIACGMNDHISKPIELPALYATLQRLIKPKSKTDNHA
jgi:CheY-like chemotaxis protein